MDVLSRVSCFYLSLYLCIVGHVVFGVFGGHGHMYVTLQYLVDTCLLHCSTWWTCILWYVTYFEVGMNLCIDIFIL